MHAAASGEGPGRSVAPQPVAPIASGACAQLCAGCLLCAPFSRLACACRQKEGAAAQSEAAREARAAGLSGVLGDAGSPDFQTDEEEEGGPSLSPRSLRCALAHDMTS